MNLQEKYIDYVNRSVQNNPQAAWDKVMLGFRGHLLGKKIFPNSKLPKGYQKLEKMIHNYITQTLAHPERMVWGNIFAPSELFQAFGLNLISVEVLACYMGSGYNLEDYFIDTAQSMGITPTLCSYHKAFMGAALSGSVRPPRFSVTTSLSCDGNLNTFRFLEKEFDLPFMLLDIPYDQEDDDIEYLADQLRELAGRIESELSIKFDENKLREAIEIGNETRKELIELEKNLCKYHYPCEIMDVMWVALAAHIMMGSKELLEVIRYINKDIVKQPLFEGKKILWVHLLPYYQQSLKQKFNYSDKYQLLGSDMLLDFKEQLDPEKPFESLARKIAGNVFNGSYYRKSDLLVSLAKDLEVDGVVHFCHWGCKQACGGSVLLKEQMSQAEIPMLILDGDGIDERNSHDGQIKTRLEAFLEMLDKEETC